MSLEANQSLHRTSAQRRRSGRFGLIGSRIRCRRPWLAAEIYRNKSDGIERRVKQVQARAFETAPESHALPVETAETVRARGLGLRRPPRRNLEGEEAVGGVHGAHGRADARPGDGGDGLQPRVGFQLPE